MPIRYVRERSDNGAIAQYSLVYLRYIMPRKKHGVKAFFRLLILLELRHIKCYRSEEEEKAKKGSLRHNRCYRKEASKYGAEIESGILGGDTIQVFEGMSSRQDADTGGIL
jgi:hypothetical protein